jgi:hypothetical protein
VAARLKLDGVVLEGEYDPAALQASSRGTPWINTNMGFLRFARAATDSPVWSANGLPRALSFR